MTTTFNSRDIRCRSPLGAVPARSELTITATPERRQYPLRAFFRLRADGAGDVTEYPMARTDETDEFYRYALTLPVPETAGLYFYSFRFENEGGSYFFGAPFDAPGGEGTYTGCDLPREYQLTVYDEPAELPRWFAEGVTYNIFPDRFYRTAVPDEADYRARDRRIHANWSDTPDFRPDETGEVKNNDFFGGTFRGVQEKLPYLAEMHVGCIYINPIFEAYSNHRYDTADYLRPDPMLGTEDDFRNLCKAAKLYGIRIILDGVFSHTGSDSVYFNRNGRYGEGGAYRTKESPFFEWYTFHEWPNGYNSWWGIQTLPEVNEMTPSYLDFIVRSEESVIRKWMRLGASGFRLDVADELPDEFIFELRKAVSEEDPEGIVIGEVWEDASNKIAYERRRKYILGGGLHGVMNYPFREAVVAYLKAGDAAGFRARMEVLLENYPRDVLHSSMNLLSTHDIPRILTVLGANNEDYEGPKERRENLFLPPDVKARAKELLKIGAALQYAFPGTPLVCYGDEAGMEGFEDPFNRRAYPWGREDADLLAHYRTLGRVRAEERALRSGDVRFVLTDGPVLAFARDREGDSILFLANAGETGASVSLDAAYVDLLSGKGIPAGEWLVPALGVFLLKKGSD
ncbi:glycoside hydrolase family 13 protein [Oscillospiraceae bacterium OttesenSCG-928-G22]|nr:glycoside hydrolase family 13 protein [Oscillospiraceae bacterium OttesenSCG-928-G22]